MYHIFLRSKNMHLNMRRLRLLSLGAVFALGATAGCNFVDASFAEGGIQGTGFSLGPITQFGSIYVNGTRYNTDSADYEINGNTAGSLGDNDLQQGMIVRVEGQWRSDNTGRADKVVYDDTLRGTISAKTWDTATRAGQFTLLGQTVHLTGQTVFAGTTAETLAAGTRVSVSAWANADGTFRASLVAVQTNAALDDQLEGTISNLTALSFNIGSLVVSYTNSTALNGVNLANGTRVQVTGAFDQAESEFMAKDINFDDQTRIFRGKAGDDAEFTGPIENLNTTTNSMTINGITVTWRAGDNDVFDDDLTEADLQNGLLVQIEGDWRSDGTVRAKEIELREANAELEARVESRNASDYTLQVGGVKVLVTPFTILLDDDNKRLSRDEFFVSTLVGTWLEIDGIDRADDNGNRILEAIKIEREDEDDDDDYELEGRITGKGTDNGENYVQVLGVRLVIPNDSVVENGSFNSLKVGDMIEAKYRKNGTTYTATDIDVEDDDD